MQMESWEFLMMKWDLANCYSEGISEKLENFTEICKI